MSTQSEAKELMDFYKTISLDDQIECTKAYSLYEKADPETKAKVEKILRGEMPKEELAALIKKYCGDN